MGHIHDSDIGEPSQQLYSLQANNVVALVESIDRTLEVSLASVSQGYPQDAAGFSGLGAALAASHSGVRTGRPPLRSGLQFLEREEEGAKICGADLLVSKSPRCDMADVGCGCGVSLGNLALW
jgi:hypothetical protein